MKDYYKILGVEEEASEEEIRARWVELTKVYHPDLMKTEEGDEKIKEINEAYEILKDESTRFHYDFERDLKRSFIKKAHRRQEREMSVRKIILIPSGVLVLLLIVSFLLFRSGRIATSPGPAEKTKVLHETDKASKKMTASQAPRPSPSAVERESEQKKEPPRVVLPEAKVSVRVDKEPPAKKESESEGKPSSQVVMEAKIPATQEVSKEVRTETPKLIAQEVPREVPKEAPRVIPKEIPKEVAREIPKEAPKEAAKEVAREAPKEVRREVPKEVPKEIPKEVAKETPKEVPRVIPKETPKEVAREIPRETPKEVAKEVPKEAPKETTTVTLHPGEHLTVWTKGERIASSRTSPLAKEEEVKQFFSSYVDRYHRKDIDGFLSCFSSRAVQNRTDRSEAIRGFYAELFNQSQDLRYQIEGMKIEISQHRVDVKARFRVDQKLKKDGEEKVWKGNVRWVLVKEEGRLKISSLDYQNEKSP